MVRTWLMKRSQNKRRRRSKRMKKRRKRKRRKQKKRRETEVIQVKIIGRGQERERVYIPQEQLPVFYFLQVDYTLNISAISKYCTKL